MIPGGYGPHRPEDALRLVWVGHRASRKDPEREVPAHPAIVRQREQINTHAHKQKGSTDV